MSEELPAGSGESDIRRRAAWLLAMLALVAALFVAFMVTFLGTSGGDHKGSVADIGAPSATESAPSATHSRKPGIPAKSTPGSSTSGSSSSPRRHQTLSCPSNKPCVAAEDIGDAIVAVNAYRKGHGLPVVAGSVSEAAQKCALSNGSDCSGGWAESQVPGPDGTAAVEKIQKFGKLLDPNITSIEVGWAYNPVGKQYYFAVIRNE